MAEFELAEQPVRALDMVYTIKELSIAFNFSRGAIINAIHKDYIAARKSAGAWLIDLRSFVNYLDSRK